MTRIEALYLNALQQQAAMAGAREPRCRGGEVLMATGDHEGTSEERTPLPGVEVLAVLAYLYAEAGIRARMLGATDEERLAHAAVRQDIRELAEHYERTGRAL